MRKKFSAAAWLLAAVVLCGCGSGEVKKEELSSEKEQLVIWSYYETQAQREGLDVMLRDFNQSQNKYEVSWEYVPMTGFAKGLSSAYTENKLPDMVILDNPDTPTMIRLGLFEDITKAAEQWNLEEEYYSSIVETVKYDGSYYGIPFNCNSTALIYNRTMLEEAGLEPPTDWESFLDAAKMLTTQEHSGFTMCSMEGEQGAFQILSWILAAGGTPPDIKGEAWQETFDFFAELLDSGSMPENCINLTQTDVAREFTDGKTAMIQNGPWVFPALDESGIDYGIVPIPGRKLNAAVLGGENIAVVKGKNTDGALAFLNFCVNGDALLQFCKTASVLPARISEAEKMAEENEKMEVFADQMEYAITRTSVSHWGTVSQELTDGMYQLIKK